MLAKLADSFSTSVLTQLPAVAEAFIILDSHGVVHFVHKDSQLLTSNGGLQ